jgi:Helix-turn-helix domain
VINLLTTEKLAEITGEPPQRWRARRVTGDTPPFQKIGRRAYYLESDVTAWLESRRCSNTAEAKAARIARIEGTSK